MSDLWYKNTVMYGVDVAVFQDSNGDGIGDFQGLLQRINYLAQLGVTTLWLLPFYASPRRDNGFDVTDYYAVHPKLGTLDDFIDVVHRAGEYRIRVLLDLVMDHTSNEHPWFQAARRDPHSRFRQYYVWETSPPPVEPGKGNIFPDSESTVWTYDNVGAAYYYHRFYHFEPDLNVANPEVRDEIKRVMDFWLSFGVAGFRLDAASHMIESHGIAETEVDEPHAILKDLRAGLTARRQDAVLLGEADEPADTLGDFFGDGDELHLLYNFLLDNYLFLALARQRAEPVARALRLLRSVPECCHWVNFLRNLDELDLERLTEAEREDVYRAFAPEPAMRVFGRGIRRRLAPMLGSRPRLEMALSLLFSMPGIPMLIYGDEMGMGDDLALEERNAVRTPMQWAPEAHAGFSTAQHDPLSRPVIGKGPYSFTHVNVADQARDPGSMLNWVKGLIMARRQCPEWGCREAEVLVTEEPSVLAHRCHWKSEAAMAVHNLGDQSCSVKLHLPDVKGPLARIFGNTSEQVHADRFVLDLPPMVDFGYDVSDYTNIHPTFGTLEDLDRLLSGAHGRGLRLILDFVPNHTSDQHPWFMESRSSCTNPKRDWYIWRDPSPDGGPPNNWLSTFGGSAWEWDATTQQYYYHAYLKAQPDLNSRHLEVQDAMHDVMRFWLNRGVDGFRIDVIWHMVKDDQFRCNPPNPDYRPGEWPYRQLLATYTTDRPEVHDIIAGMRRVMDEYDDRMMVGGIYLPVERLVTYYGTGGSGVHLPFNFHLIELPWHAPTIASMIDAYEAALPPGGWPNWVLSNHDKPRIATRIGNHQARVAAMLLLTLRGTPTLYYGDEIGMANVVIPPDQVQDPWEKNEPGHGLGRDPTRTPMQWDGTPNAGFTSGPPWLPVAEDYAVKNVATERESRTSMLTLYRRLIALRRRELVLTAGRYLGVEADREVISYVRENGKQRFLVVLNLLSRPQTVSVKSLQVHGRLVLSTYLDREDEAVDGTMTLREDEGIIVDCLSV